MGLFHSPVRNKADQSAPEQFDAIQYIGPEEDNNSTPNGTSRKQLSLDLSAYTAATVMQNIPAIFQLARESEIFEVFREHLSQYANKMAYNAFNDYGSFNEGSIIRVRDCARVLHLLMTRRAEAKARFSFTGAIYDLAHGKNRPDLTPAFFAEVTYLFLGLEGRGPGTKLVDCHITPIEKKGRFAAIERSFQLDNLSADVNSKSKAYISGLDENVIERRETVKQRILKILGGSESDWIDWRWQVSNILRDVKTLSSMVNLSDEEAECIKTVRKAKIPFGITPYYVSLMDENFSKNGLDRAIRAQVIPPLSYLENIQKQCTDPLDMDFMLETDTSPIDLITRRYPAICIIKPFNTCPQICVYCQRNWEIKDAMQDDALASPKVIDDALSWIQRHSSIHEILITGGDPLAMTDREIEYLISRLSKMTHIERIRIGTRVIVTLPMRVTDKLVEILAKFSIAGKRQIAVMTHIQHPYEITPNVVECVDKLRRNGISVYNQLVYTSFISRKFEAASLRRLLTLIGIDPYYTFCVKGKPETAEYRVPISRILQEQNEEARLLPGLSRTDEAVFNIPGLGKNYLRRQQDRDLISILPDGRRLYEFHPWEKYISGVNKTYIFEDVPILDYLQHLAKSGEDVQDYRTIWYYF